MEEKQRTKYSKVKAKIILTIAECGLVSKRAVRLMNDKRTNRNNMVREMKSRGVIKEVGFKIHYWYTHEIDGKKVSEKRLKTEKAYRLEDIEQNREELKKYLTDEQIEKAKETRQETMKGVEGVYKRLLTQSEVYMFMLNAKWEMEMLDINKDYATSVEIKDYAKKKSTEISGLSIKRARAYGVVYGEDCVKIIYYNGNLDYKKMSRTAEKDFYKAAYDYKNIKEPDKKERIVLIEENSILKDIIRRTWTKTYANGISSTHNSIIEDVYDVAHVLPMTKEGSMLFAMLLTEDYKIIINNIIEESEKAQENETGKVADKHYNYLTADAHVLYKAMKESEITSRAYAGGLKSNKRFIVHCYSFMADAVRETVPQCEIREYDLNEMLFELIT